ncbi:MAG: hypothetical protein M1822_006152 [Bathelium mastoideum]|nr:MAG: hypothetical protein M1822_006152 [Bathelium mastoideum]
MASSSQKRKRQQEDETLQAVINPPKTMRISSENKTFRVQGIPFTIQSKADVEKLLSEVLSCSQDDTGLRCQSLAVDHSEKNQQATVSFSSALPGCLEPKVLPFNARINPEDDDSDTIHVDASFLGITTLSSCSGAKHRLNILALSGIGGHAFGSFKARGSPFMWLRDELPKDLPGCRVMIWGYESKISGSNDSQNLSDIASKLRFDLLQLEEAVRSKRFIFIAHSLGGLVLKTLIAEMCTSEHQPEKEILNNIAGILLFGVPGLGLETRVIDSLVQMAHKQPNEHLLQSISTKSDGLRLLQSKFKRGFNKNLFPQSHIYSIYETEKSPTAVKTNNGWRMDGPAELFVNEISATSSREGEETNHFKLAIGENHSNMIKFSPGGEDYKRVLTIMRACAEAPSTKAKSVKYELSDSERSCLHALYTSDYMSHKGRNPDRVEGTCQWVLQHPNFSSWLHDDKSSLLWISADPGCGKSVLAKSLVDIDLKHNAHSSSPFFFFKEDNEEQRTAANAIAALLHQLFSDEQNAHLIKHAMREFQNKDKKIASSFHTLWDIFIKAATDPAAGETICVIDALDECEEAGRGLLLEALENFFSHEARSSLHIAKLKLLITSRPYLNIERSFAYLIKVTPSARLEGEHELKAISGEIDLVIKKKIPELATRLELDQPEQLILQDKLLSIQHRTYLWLHLVFEDILRDIDLTRTKFENIVNNVPESVDRAYETILSRSRNRDPVMRLLCIVVAAARPLSLRELNIALAIEDQHTSCSDLELEPERRFKTTMRNLCGLFVQVVDDKIYLIHQTAKEFLLGEEQSRLTTSFEWKSSIQPSMSEYVLAKQCMTYLLFSELKRDWRMSMDPIEAEGEISRFNIEARAKAFIIIKAREHGFLNYAAMHWTEHFKAAQKYHRIRELTDIGLSLFDVDSGRFCNWYRIYSFDSPVPPYIKRARLTSLRPVTLCIIYGHIETLRALLKLGVDLSAKTGRGDTVLHFAVDYKDENVVKSLVEADAPIDEKNKYGHTPLRDAIADRNGGIVKILIDGGANVNVRDSKGLTLLSDAITMPMRDKTMVRLLLDAGADPEVRSHDGRPALSLAAGCFDRGMVDALLEAGASIEAVDSQGRTALWVAAEKDDTDTAQALVDAGVDVNVQDIHGATVLFSVSNSKRSKVMVELLLKAGADIEAKNNRGNTALWLASYFKKENLFQTLLDAGAQINSGDLQGLTPLSYQANWAREDAWIKMLLQAGADHEVRDKKGLTALLWAATNSHLGDKMVEILLEAGADIEAKDKSGRTVLSWATENNHFDTVLIKRLLKGGALIDAVDVFGWTCLTWAIFLGRTEAVKTLLQSGANLEARDAIYGRVALSWAVKHWEFGWGGRGEIVEMLLDHGAEVEAKDAVYGRTALSWAAEEGWGGRGEIVEMLLDHGAEVEAKDAVYGRTALSWAAEEGSDENVRALLDAGADIKAKDKDGRTARSWALQNGLLEEDTLARLS